MAQTPQYKRGAADGNQLPKGAASDLNAAAAQASEGEQPQPGDEGFQPPQYQTTRPQPQDHGPSGAVGGEDDQMLFGPTSRPNEPIQTGQALYQPTSIPPDSHKWLPALVDAAQDPSAPQFFKDMLALVHYHLQNGQ